MDYLIKKSDNKIYVASDNQYLVYDMTIQRYLNNLLIKKLNNLKTLEKMTKKLFNFDNKIPLYIADNILLLCITSYRMEESCYINYHEIKKHEVYDKGIIISFYNNHELKLPKKIAYINQMKKARMIIEYFNKQLN
ncbi:MAG: hypothetical protein RBR66_00735 [Candidatus Izemoplasmatales bacterium]|nr:hypothetical protein [Candidatus Izemoplasmatales bacterium]